MKLAEDFLTFNEQGIYYYGKLLNQRQFNKMLIKALVDNDQKVLKVFKDYFLTDGRERLLVLWPEIIKAFNDYDLIYNYAQVKRLDQNQINTLTKWVAFNGNPQQIERFLINVPYVDADYLDQLISENKQTKQQETMLDLTTTNELSSEQIDKILDLLINRGNAKQIYAFALKFPNADLNKIENALINKSLADNDLEYLYKLHKNINNINLDKIERAIVHVSEQMPIKNKFSNAKYFFYLTNSLKGLEKEMKTHLKNSQNIEYIAYQIVFNDDELLLLDTYKDYQSLYQLSKSCQVFFVEQEIKNYYLNKLEEKICLNNKPKYLIKTNNVNKKQNFLAISFLKI